MGADVCGFALLNLLLVVLVFGLVLLFPWSELWRKPVVREEAARGPRSFDWGHALPGVAKALVQFCDQLGLAVAGRMACPRRHLKC